ncbi:MAG: NAD-dependent epimerase/dehydratase family protein [Chloroflexi bacterium]|jgi:dihydroflavonol-4-reductase|nr:NAD-dependent epimerase/dehydratase family protein [Chloroflexota bacterium]
MRALVTGGTGFVGSAVVRALLQERFQVACLVRSNSDLRNLEGLDVTLVEGDLGDRAALEQALRGCQHLYHVAACYSTRPDAAAEMFRVNVEGTRNVLSAAAEAGVAAIVHTSTIGTIGRPKGNRLPNEADVFNEWKTASPYARSKLEGERIALELASQGAPVVVVNPCAPVGERDIKPSSTGARIVAYLRGQTPSYLPGGINFVPVEDVARGHLLAAWLGKPGERYILGHAEGNLQLADFYALMERVSGLAAPQAGRFGPRRLVAALRSWLRPEKPRPVGFRPAALTADPTRAIRELGLSQTPLEEAFGRAVAWFRANGYV